MNLLVF